MSTSKIGSNLDRSAKKIVDRRSRIWEDYDRTIANVTELNRYENTYGNAQISEELAPLTQDNTPPTEIAAVTLELAKQKAIISRAKSEIEANLAAIATTKQEFFKAAGIAGGILTAIILFLIFTHK